MKFMTVLLLALFYVIIGFSGVALSSEVHVAIVSNVEGEASVIRNELSVTAKTGMKLLERDMIETGPDGAIGLIFSDNTVLSLGPDSKLAINEFVFAPGQGKFSLILRLFKGTAAYLSGLIAELSPESAKLETPKAVLGFRGTKVLVQVEE